MPRKTFSFFLSILLIEMVVFILILPGCKGRSGISPIIPPEDNPYGNLPPSSGNPYDRSTSESNSNVRLIITGPSEYLSSELDPPLITESQPTFSARVENLSAPPSPDDFIARIDIEKIQCDFNLATNEIQFKPKLPLKDGHHIAMLYFRNPNGFPRDYLWTFIVETKPPELVEVMWNNENKLSLMIFDRSVEYSLLTDTLRWQFNNERNITRGNIELMGSNMALLPLNDNAFSEFTAKVPLTIVFQHKNGPVYYVVRRGGAARDAQFKQPPCDCTGIKVDILREHHLLEAGAEKYAFAYEVTNPKNCSMIKELIFHIPTRIPVANNNPESSNNSCDNFDREVDELCEGPPLQEPMTFQMEFENGHIGTISFDRLYKYQFGIAFWADCTTQKRPDGNPCETFISEKSFNFSESFDCQLPVFEHEPEVLYGDEAAVRLLELTADWDFYDEPINHDKYCSSLTEEQFTEWYVKPLTENPCDLFIITEAIDMVTSERGNIKPIVLDIKYGGTTEYCEYGNVLVDMGIGLFYDVSPWPGRRAGQSEYELILDWPDPNYCWDPEGEPPACVWHDWDGAEGAIEIFPLTEKLIAPTGKDITDIRVRITDNTPSCYPYPDPEGKEHAAGNWRRSGNVLDQLCDNQQRSGSLYRSGASVRPGVHLKVEPGVAPENQNDPELYWIDGPAIRIYGEGGDEAPNPPEVIDCLDDWDLYSLQHKWLPFRSPNPKCPIGSYVPRWESMKVGQIRMRVCIDCICDIAAFRIYAINQTTRRRYDIREPLTNSIYFTDIERYRGNCISPPLKCLDPNFIVWNISNIPCGEYKIYVECYDEIVFDNAGCLDDPEKFLKARSAAESPKIKLDKVIQSDLVRIAPIYEGDDYESGGSYRPRNNHDDNNNDTVDCCNYVTQLLRRLARTESGAYPIRHTDAITWRSGRADQVEVIQFGQLEAGDIIVWMDTSHVGIFDRWDIGNPDHQPENGVYYAWIWESRHCDGVGCNRHKLGVSSSNRGSDYHWHGARQWIEDIVFSICPAQ